MIKRFSITFLCALAAFSLQARTIDRGLGNPKSVYIGRGTWQAGVSGSYNSYDAEGLNGAVGTSLLGIVTDLSGQATIGGMSVYGARFLADNIAVGARFGWESVAADFDNAKVLSLVDIHNRHTEAMHLTGAVYCRAYIPLFDSRILALFGEAAAGGRRGYTKDYENTDRGKLGTYSDDFALSMDISSGVSVFVNNYCALSFSLQVGRSWSKQIKEGEPMSTRSRVYAEYKPDLLGISIGVSYNF